MEEKYRLNKLLFPYFNNLKDYFNQYSKDIISEDNPKIFEKISKATIIKSYELNFSITALRGNHIFFMLPSLRGICEEYIVEKFIFKHFSTEADRNTILALWLDYQLLKSSIAQWKDFEINKPDQLLYYEESFPKNLIKVEKEIKDIFKRKFTPIKLNPFPSIYFMAEKAELVELYNYFYHGTSTFVHFHPRNLFRMAWGQLPNIQFTTANFDKYHNFFTVFYSTMLFCKLCDSQLENGYLKDIDVDTINKIKETLENESSHPEIVTFDKQGTTIFMNYSSMFVSGIKTFSSLA